MKIIFTGGGSGGHVIPNIAIINSLKEKHPDIEIVYIGSKTGIEKELISEQGIKYREIETGKLRRYLSKENIKDFFRVFKGIKEAKEIIKEEKPDLVFSKGGFVAVPVVIGAKKNKVPVVCHESDLTPGLANKIAGPFAKKVCVTFPETLKMVGKKGVLCGSPIRSEILKGDRKRGLELLGFNEDKKVLLVIGGSLGSVALNDAIKEAIDELTEKYQIIHICGKGKSDMVIKNKEGVKQFEYVNEELADFFAASDLIISRAGAGSIFELLALAKPNLLMPLTKKASRGDQILNAESFEKQGFGLVIDEDTISKEGLLSALVELEVKAEEMTKTMKQTNLTKANDSIIKVIEEELHL
ncbi:MAG: undecaprenyldiphospho-muramoylpentapeptide beta-N-acetylglucosaminyltransferase [Clostridia bacterium]|nr:undecaprenyldiphospho-muramoylpentapeptide beta-N-acetylglucosaminyltransferase [Clostridia bacterium]